MAVYNRSNNAIRGRHPDRVLHRLRPTVAARYRALCAVANVFTFAYFASSIYAQLLPWDYQPYRIRAIVALDVPGGIAEQLTAEIPTYLERRVVAAIGPIWSFDIELATGALRRHVLSDVAARLDKPPADIPWADVDKLVLISLRWSPNGYSLAAREFDTIVQRWSTPIRRVARQPDALPEAVFAIICQTIAPIAQFEVAADDEKHAILTPRGASLMRPGTAEPWTKPGDVYLPILRRTSRGGELVENGIQIVPWTFLEVVENGNTESPRIAAQIHSGTRRPLAARRQGRVEQVAIALRSDPAPTVLRIHSRVADDKPLVGYEVFAQTDPNRPDALARLGATGRDGTLEVPPAARRVRLLIVKNGGHLLARLPIVPGAQAQVDVPLPDDDARLAAETHLASVREDLIDVVARRNILMARARQKIKDKDFDAAEKLVLEINQLPGRAQFNMELTNARRRMRSPDPRIQRRIDQLFDGTQSALTQYLDTRPVNDLTNELRAAQQEKGS